MVKKLSKWATRLLIVAAVVAVVVRFLESPARSGRAGREVFPPIGGDTWPPVPTNSKRGH